MHMHIHSYKCSRSFNSMNILFLDLFRQRAVGPPCINLELVRKGGTILYCDYVVSVNPHNELNCLMTLFLNVTYVKVYISGIGQDVFDLCFWC